MTPPRWQRHGARSIRSETWLTPRNRLSLSRPLSRNESGIEQTVVAFDVTLKMPTSQQGADISAGNGGLLCPPTSRPGAPGGESWGVRRDPAGEWPRCGVFLFRQAERVRRDPNCFGAEDGNPSAECPGANDHRSPR